jgi:hypothetical protein
MAKPPANKFNSVNSKTNETTPIQPSEPFYSEEVNRWRASNGNASLLGAFYEAVNELNTEENRISKPKSDGYIHWCKACHRHFTKKLAIFYEYKASRLCLLAVMQHLNDSNLWKRA